jgi:tRNA pseudouridine55 synthase
MHGFAIVDKPEGWTSHDVVAKMRRILGTRRIGHAGTLDPMATGVLPLLIGRATRALNYLPGEKAYTAVMRLGIETDTQDITGTVTSETKYRPDKAAVYAAFDQFTGTQTQIPPMYSAVKIGGRKLYELARAGIEVERKPRTVVISELTVLSVDGDDITFHAACSAGTYIRTLCHDIGRLLGCGAVMTALRRTMACGYSAEQAYTLDEWQEKNPILLPVDSAFAAYPSVTVNALSAAKIRNGAPVFGVSADDGMVRVYDEADEFLMLGKIENKCLITIKSFYTLPDS